jgi:uncharacterized phage protein (TIGR01671 family)
MRAIEFRGIAKNTNEFVYGCLIALPFGKSYILFGNYDNKVEVHPETIGQFTGLLDKNGTKIYENDIIRINDFENKRWVSNREQVVKIEFGEAISYLQFIPYCEVIGNIHKESK